MSIQICTKRLRRTDALWPSIYPHQAQWESKQEQGCRFNHTVSIRQPCYDGAPIKRGTNSCTAARKGIHSHTDPPLLPPSQLPRLKRHTVSRLQLAASAQPHTASPATPVLLLLLLVAVAGSRRQSMHGASVQCAHRPHWPHRSVPTGVVDAWQALQVHVFNSGDRAVASGWAVYFIACPVVMVVAVVMAVVMAVVVIVVVVVVVVMVVVVVVVMVVVVVAVAGVAGNRLRRGSGGFYKQVRCVFAE